MKSSNVIRNEFIEFFRSKDHNIIKSASVIPQDDPTLLFTNAGMNQFKSYFLGLEKPVFSRIADTQKCIRVSGKHNDLEEVGKDNYHHTFFEMLGNWSFGDYYKKDALRFAWELLTEVWKIPKDRLWATVYKKDSEALKLWKEVTDIDPERILKFGEKENFWEMGSTGPCGPCSEIHYYKGDHPENQKAEGVNSGDPHYIELWNLVFIQFDRDEKGVLTELPQKHVDTGAGLERIVAVLQNKHSNYDTDLLRPIIDKISEFTGIAYTEEGGMAHRVIADHVRMLSFAIADGGMPSNEGRGYVIRRILRRASRFARKLNVHTAFIYRLTDVVEDIYRGIYPEISEHKEHIEKVIKAEEETFSATLDRGLDHFERIITQLQGEKLAVISGPDIFKLYDTYGFPFDLTRLLAEEKGFQIDEDGFYGEMDKQRLRARANLAFDAKIAEEDKQWTIVSEGEDSVFIGYDSTKYKARIRRYYIENEKVHVILDKTPFYAESGGQVGDKGTLTADDVAIEIENTIRVNQAIIHIGMITHGVIGKEAEVMAEVHDSRIQETQLNHTATHLLQAALRQVLGVHVHQAGSHVAPESLRFDLTHYSKISSDELREVERIVNARIRENIEVKTFVQDYEEAKKAGAMALFGEKYDKIVRVVKIEGFSQELCGGTHVKRTGDIGLFKIVSESSVAAGIRRIEAITGRAALEYSIANESIVEELEKVLSVPRQNLASRVQDLISDHRAIEKKLKKEQASGVEDIVSAEIADAKSFGDLKVFTRMFENKSMDDLKSIGDIVRNALQEGVGVLASVSEDKPLVVVVVTDLAIKNYDLKAGAIVKELGKILGGGGGGQPHLATAGGRFPDKIEAAFSRVYQLVEEKISKN